jgi:hypothetical protein
MLKHTRVALATEAGLMPTNWASQWLLVSTSNAKGLASGLAGSSASAAVVRCAA